MKKKVLIVDDDFSIAETCRLILDDHGFDVEVVCDGGLAVEKISSESFDVVVSDFMMPNVDGVSLYRWVKNNRPWMGFVLMSGLSSKEVPCGDFQCLQKPFAPEKMIEAINLVA